MSGRFKSLVKRGVKLAALAAQYPDVIPILVKNVGGHGAHVGEVLNAGRHRAWLQNAGINTVLDAGAHQGEFASGIKSVLPHAQVYSFEPQRDCFSVLEERLKGYSCAQPFCLALGSSSGQTTFHQNSFTKSSSLLPMSDLHREAFPFTAHSHDITVQVSTLDALAPKLNLTPKVLFKLDVQGFELEVLKGAVGTLESVHYILVETSVGPTLYEGEATLDQVTEFLAPLGFRFSFLYDQLENPNDGTVLQVDAVFVR